LKIGCSSSVCELLTSVLDIPVPFREKPGEEYFQKTVPFFRPFFSRRRLHAVFQQQEFFVKVIDGRTGFLLVGCKRRMLFRRLLGIIHRPAEMSAEREGPRDSNGSERIESIGILHAAAFQGVHLRRHAGPFERHSGNDGADLVDQFGLRTLTAEPFARGAGPGGFVSAMKFPIGDVVQQRGQFAELFVGPFRARQQYGISPDAVDMPPVVSGSVLLDPLADEIRSLCNEQRSVGHKVAFISTGRIALAVLWVQRR